MKKILNFFFSNLKGFFLHQFSNENCNRSKVRGFTLIELLLGASLFVAGIGALMTILIDTLRTTRLNMELVSKLDNVRFVLERITKVARFGIISNIPAPGSYTTNELTIRNLVLNAEIRFWFDSDSKQIKETFTDLGPPVGSPLTSNLSSSDLEIENLTFKIDSYGCGEDRQPRITVSIRFKKLSEVLGELPSLQIQTVISQRCLEEIYPECKFIQPECS